MNIESEIINILKEAIQKTFNIEVNPLVFKNKNADRGDYFSQIAVLLSKQLGKSPFEISTVLEKEIDSNNLFSKIVITENGFINFFINKISIVEQVLTQSIEKTPIEINSLEKIIVEHTSVNPNKAMHIGHIRNAVFGSTIVNILKAKGNNVEVHNYIDDTGLQVADTTNAVLNLNISQKNEETFENYAWDIYTKINQEYKAENKELLEKREVLVHEIESLQGDNYNKSVEVVDKIVKSHLQLMAKFNIYYDLLVYESDIIHFGFWDEAFELLKKSSNFYLQSQGKQAGCYVLKSSDPTVEDKIFVRNNGTKVYTAKDTAYHLWKFGKLTNDFLYKDFISEYGTEKTDKQGQPSTEFGKATTVITLTDERQSYALNAVKEALKQTGFTTQASNMHHIAYGVVSLSKNTAQRLGVDTSDNKEYYSMSGRQGIGVKVTDLLNLIEDKVKEIQKNNNVESTSEDITSIAVAAIKHYLLKYNPLSPIVFDYEQALQITGNTGPYLLYSYVRANNILNKAVEFNKTFNKATLTESEEKLILSLQEFDTVLQSINFEFNTSKIADYAFNLSKTFHAFYEKDNVLNAEESTKNFRLSLVLAYKQTLTKVLNLMGIIPVQRM